MKEIRVNAARTVKIFRPFAYIMTGLLLSMQAFAVKEGEMAPDFTLPDIHEGGQAVSLQQFRGKTVYVDFWASWCAPCLRSLPLINELYGKYREQGFEVIAINVDDPVEDGQDFLLDVDLDYLTPADTANKVLEAYGVQGMPTSYLIDTEGVVRKVHTGFREGDIEILEEEIRKLLAESAD
jgi:cytochrome c biogenesis protein CcmG/thiol:disulfide interchange protein DsbE